MNMNTSNLLPVTATPWAPGRLLITRTTAEWTTHARSIAEAHESRLLFANFSAQDDGRGRIYVAEFARPEDTAYAAMACTEYPRMLKRMRLMTDALVRAKEELRLQGVTALDGVDYGQGPAGNTILAIDRALEPKP